eukprot:c9245_g1_i1.p1 GENE.c9245_g1_i1~~c9245_g1_i1.p1  ORF type:complete len:311 (+),score=113.75 c9245_g1_i1:69-1001(+)
MTAEQEKETGNKFFQNQDYFKAAACYTKAIKLDPSNHVLYSNRAAAFLKMENPKDVKALADADKCIELSANWAKGHFRRAQALVSLNRFDEAKDEVKKCMTLDPEMKKDGNALLKTIQTKKSTKLKDDIDTLQTIESFKQIKLIPDSLSIEYTEARCDSFFKQVLESIRLSVSAGSSNLAHLDAMVVVLSNQISPSGEIQRLERFHLEQALLSEPKQQYVAKLLREQFQKNPAHAFIFTTTRNALLAPRKWEQLKETVPAKSNGIFVQFQSQTSKKLVYLPLEKNKSKNDENDFVDLVYTEYAIIPPVFS